MEGLTCYSAPEKVFNTRNELLAHYKTDWHAYNLKRKVKQLPPVTENIFNRVKEQIDQQRRILEKSDLTKKTDHLKNTTKKVKKSKKSGSLLIQKARLNAIKLAKGENGSISSDVESFFTTDQSSGVDTDLETDEEDKMVLDLDEAEKSVNYCQSLFELDENPLVFDTIAENLDFMLKTYGFFVPDKEYLKDCEGLIRYCSQKIRVGKLCLFCDKRFSTNNAVIQHMISKNHCKLNWEPIENNDLGESEELFDEFGEFYDYSKEELVKKSNVVVEMLETGEILLKNDGKNKIIGKKMYKKYYKQYQRTIEKSDALVANESEAELRLMKLFDTKKEMSLSKNIFKMMTKFEKKIQRKSENQRQYVQSRLRLRDGLQNNLITRHKTHGKVQIAGE